MDEIREGDDMITNESKISSLVQSIITCSKQ
jgi:hypothetical protein